MRMKRGETQFAKKIIELGNNDQEQEKLEGYSTILATVMGVFDNLNSFVSNLSQSYNGSFSGVATMLFCMSLFIHRTRISKLKIENRMLKDKLKELGYDVDAVIAEYKEQKNEGKSK